MRLFDALANCSGSGSALPLPHIFLSFFLPYFFFFFFLPSKKKQPASRHRTIQRSKPSHPANHPPPRNIAKISLLLGHVRCCRSLPLPLPLVAVVFVVPGSRPVINIHAWSSLQFGRARPPTIHPLTALLFHQSTSHPIPSQIRSNLNQLYA